MAQSRTKLALALSDEELEQFLAELRQVQGLTGAKLREMAEAKGITIGHNSANEFLNEEFKPYCEKISRARQLSLMIATQPDDAPSGAIAAAGAEEISQRVFEFLMSAEGLSNLATKEGLKQVKDLTEIISMIQQAAARRDEVRVKLQREFDRKTKETKKAVDAKLKATAGEITEETRTAILDLIDEKMGLK